MVRLPRAYSARAAAAAPLLSIAIAVAGASHAQVNLDFESTHSPASDVQANAVPGWDARDDDAVITLDTAIRRGGSRSLRLVKPEIDGRSGFSQAADARTLRADRIRISAYVKLGIDAAGTPTLRVRVDDHAGLIYIGRAGDESTAADADGWRRLEIEAPLAPTARRLSFGGEFSGRGTAWFDEFSIEPVDLDALPAAAAAAARYVEYALSIIDDHALVRADVDWPAFRRDVMRQARGAVSIEDSYLALRYALGALADGHSYFMSAERMTALDRGPVENARTSRPPVAPRGSLLAGSAGYLSLPGFAGGTHIDRVEFAEAVQRIIADIDTDAECGWIVDLRDNSGGNLWPMLAGIGPLLGDGEVAVSIRPDGARRSVWYDGGRAGLGDYVQLRVRGEAYRLRRSHARVAVITDDETASAAEIIAAAFSTHSRSRSFGASTRGVTTATRIFELSDGAALVLAVASTSDRNGRVLAGPLAPDEAVAATQGGLALEDQPAIGAALGWLAAEHAGETGNVCGRGGPLRTSAATPATDPRPLAGIANRVETNIDAVGAGPRRAEGVRA